MLPCTNGANFNPLFRAQPHSNDGKLRPTSTFRHRFFSIPNGCNARFDLWNEFLVKNQGSQPHGRGTEAYRTRDCNLLAQCQLRGHSLQSARGAQSAFVQRLHSRPGHFASACNEYRVYRIVDTSAEVRSPAMRGAASWERWHVSRAVISTQASSSHDADVLAAREAGDPRYDRLLLAPQPQLPPRVEHVLVQQEGKVVDVVARELRLPMDYVADLIKFGAIHKAKAAPPPPPNLPPEVLQSYLEFTKRYFPEQQATPPPFVTIDPLLPGPSAARNPKSEASRERSIRKAEQRLAEGKGGKVTAADGSRSRAHLAAGGKGGGGRRKEKHKGEDGRGKVWRGEEREGKETEGSRRERQKVRRVVSKDQWVEEGGYLRVHVHPRRFPSCYSVDWSTRIIAEADQFVIVDKPAGVSVNGTVDNQVECCTSFAASAIGQSEPLMVTHQLDTCTQGCVVLAKTKAFASYFNVLLQERAVHKVYKALAVSRPPIGRLVHFMLPDKFAPRILSEEAVPGWLRCELEIKSVEEVPWPSSEAMSSADVAVGDWPEQKVAFECSIVLLTGRTHQLRAQLAAVGAPLVGDTMYMAPIINAKRKTSPRSEEDKTFVDSNKALSTSSFRTVFGSTAYNANEEVNSEKHLYGPTPEGAVGLQAWKISWKDGEQTFEAGRPWWRD